MALTVSIGLVQQSSYTNVNDGAITYSVSGGTGPYTVYLLNSSFVTVQTQTSALGSGSFSGLYSNQPNSSTVGYYYILAFDNLGVSNDYANVLSTFTGITCVPESPAIGTVTNPNCNNTSLGIDYNVSTFTSGMTLDVHLAYWDGVEGSALIDLDDNTTSSTPGYYAYSTNIATPISGAGYYVVYAIDVSNGNVVYGNTPPFTYQYINDLSPVSFRYTPADPSDCSQNGSIHVSGITGGDGVSGYDVSIDGGTTWVTVPNPTTGITLSAAPGSTGTIIVRCGNGCYSAPQSYTIGTVPSISYSINVTNAITCRGTGSVQVSNITGGPGLPVYVSFNNGSTYTLVSNPTVGIIQSFAIGTSNSVIVKSGNCQTTPQSYYVSGPNPFSSTITGTTNACLFKQYTLVATPNGGVGPYTYSWKGGPTTSTYTVSSSTVGSVTYSVVITDSASCASSETITVNYGICGTSYTGTFQGGPYTQTDDMNCLTEAQIDSIYQTAINVCGCEDCSDNTKDIVN